MEGEAWERVRIQDKSGEQTLRERLYSTLRYAFQMNVKYKLVSGIVVERHPFLTSCLTNLPTITARCITTTPHFHNPVVGSLGYQAHYLITHVVI